MGKLLILLILALVVYLAIKAAFRPRPRRGGGASAAEDMVACERCGVNLPRSEALAWRGRYFCCEEHRIPGA
jgi:uncharacterized protein